MKKMLTLSLLILGSLSVLLAQEPHHHRDKCLIQKMEAWQSSQNPNFKRDLDAYHEAIPELARTTDNSRDVLTIPVVMHVIHAGENVGFGRNLSDARCLSIIDVLNEDYRRLNSDTTQTPSFFEPVAGDAEIEFCLATFDPEGFPTTGITRYEYADVSGQFTIEAVIKPATQWDPDRYLNIWICPISTSGGAGTVVAGYSYLPSQSTVGSVIDGVVLDYRFAGRGLGAQGDGRTVTHEVGHYLGLPHPWGDGGCSSDDGISDTPFQEDLYFGCPAFPQISCGSEDQLWNFMDYADCTNMFSLDQINVMRAVLQGTAGSIGYGSRASLLLNANTHCQTNIPCLDLDLNAYTMSFEDNESILGWDRVNNNMDSTNNQDNTWRIRTDPNNGYWGPRTGSNTAVYIKNDEDPLEGADDWLFMPCLNLQAGKMYELSFWYAGSGESTSSVYPEKLEVALLTSPDPNNVGAVLSTLDPITNIYPNYQQEVVTFPGPIDEVFYIGFHAYSDADQFALQLDDINLRDLSTSSVEDDLVELFEVYPNPSQGLFNVDVNLSKVDDGAELRVFDALGKQVYGQQLPPSAQQTVSIDLSGKAAGLYFVRLQAGQTVVSRSVIID